MAIELNHASVKSLFVIGLTMVLMIPLSQVENQIGVRKEHEDEAQRQVARGWGENVEFHAPILGTPGRLIHANDEETAIAVETQEKKRGVFRFPVFTARLRTRAAFAVPARAVPKAGPKNAVDHVLLAIKPIGSIQKFAVRDGSGKEVRAHLSDEGIWVNLEERAEGYSQILEFEVSARGTGPLTYSSAADSDRLTMNGNWIKPRYLEGLFPDESKLSAQGFEARWALHALPRAGDGPRQSHEVGLSHLFVGTDYAMVERATKYGILFIALTFLLVLIVEFVGGVSIHPLQYGLIGGAISIFYLLLLAMSESIGFDWAYVLSSASVTALIVIYVRGFIHSNRYVWLVLAEQVTLSGFFYLLLSLEERSFLVGSLGLFAALAFFMIGTRKVDWYAGTLRRS